MNTPHMRVAAYSACGQWLGLAACLFLSRPAEAENHAQVQVPANTAPSLVRIELANVGGLPDQPIQALCESLHTHPHTRTFKVSWQFLVGSAAMSSVLRFDRSRHQLYYYHYGWAMTETVRYYAVFSKVTDPTLYKLQKLITPGSIAADSSLSLFLPRYGCKPRTLRWPGDP